MDKHQIKARFFGQHIGCNIVALNSIGRGEHVLSGVSTTTSGGMVFFTEDGGSFTDNVTDCKLVLRPLSSITDAEAVDLFTMATGLYIAGIDRRDDKIVGVGMGKGSGNIINGGGNVAMWTKISPLPVGRLLETWNSQAADTPECAEHRAIDYLRSINICVPFMGLDPIAEGWVILAEKIPENAQQKAKKEEKS